MLLAKRTLLTGIALMTDADNTGSQAEAWYGDIQVQGLPSLRS